MTTSRRRTSRRRLHANAERWGRRAAGFLIFAKDTGRMLLMLRSGDVMEPRTWGLPGGRCEEADADERDCAIREFLEETRCPETVTGPHEPVYIFREPGFAYFNFIGYVEHEFKPVLDWENDDFGWFEFGALPSPLHFGTRRLFAEAGAKILRMVPKRRSSKRRSSRRLTANKQANPLDSAAFQRWFGDSEVVDEQGEPLVVYHGTKRDFTEFQARSKSVNTTTFGYSETERTGIFLSDNVDFARQYGGRVLALYASVENPVRLTRDLVLDFADSLEERELRILAQHTPASWQLFDGELGQHFVAYLQGRGYDGATFTEELETEDGFVEGRTFVAFSPSQIKSATDNVGTYDPTNPNIRKNGHHQ